MTDPEPGGVHSVQLAIDVLEAVAFSDDELGVTQIAERLSMTKGSVHRHLQTLVERGYLAQKLDHDALRHRPEQPAARAARTGDRSGAPGRRTDAAIARRARPSGGAVGDDAARRAGAATSCPARAPIEIGVRPGSELSFHASAQGKVMLAFAPLPMRARVLAQPLPALHRQDHRVGAQDRAGTAGDCPARFCLGAGRGDAGTERGGRADLRCARCLHRRVALVGSIQFLPEKPRPSDVAQLIETARQISRKLGHGRSEQPAKRSAPQASRTLTKFPVMRAGPKLASANFGRRSNPGASGGGCIASSQGSSHRRSRRPAIQALRT